MSLVLKRDTLLKEYTSKHPEVVAIKDEIIENARKMALTLQQQVRSLEKAQIEIAEEARAIENKTKVLLDKKLEYNRLNYESSSGKRERHNDQVSFRTMIFGSITGSQFGGMSGPRWDSSKTALLDSLSGRTL